jgi:hypothetical protein
VSFAIGAAPFMHKRILPPVASLTLRKTTASKIALPGSPLARRNLQMLVNEDKRTATTAVPQEG